MSAGNDRHPSTAAGAARRRLLLGVAGALALPAVRARAQRRPPRRIGFLSGGSKSDAAPFLASFREGLQALGWREGDNLMLDTRYADYARDDRASALAASMAAEKPAVIVANGGGIAPTYALDPPVPLVFMHSGDPVEAGFADSLARPGRHATGISLLALDLMPKRIELLREFRPDMRRIALLCSPEHAGQRHELSAAKAAAGQLAMEVTYHEARNPAELEKILPAVAAVQPEGALLFSDALMIGQRRPLASFFLQHRIPSVAGWSAFPDSGHLLSYGPERHAVWRRLAYFVDRILKGAKPGELPIELPSVIELVVNRRTAGAMNLALPRAVLQRADRVVDTPVTA
jgi:putative ABC transport system substrate-binding protein